LNGSFFVLLLKCANLFYVMQDTEDDRYAVASKDKGKVRRVVTAAEKGGDPINIALFRLTFEPRIVETTEDTLRSVVGADYEIGTLTFGATEIRAAKCINQNAASQLWVAGEAP
jgi:hypothetical protein